MSGYQFTTTWFQGSGKAIWDELIPRIVPRQILEIGSYEGASACYLIDKVGALAEMEIHCIDTWQGGIEHQADGTAPANMGDVEARFHHNVQFALKNALHKAHVHVYKQSSDDCMAAMLGRGLRNHFDFVYVDGSHQAPDVLSDAVLGFKLLKVGGIMAFDDYLWFEELPQGRDLLRCPKPAIDAFTNLYCRKLRILATPQLQLFVQKTGD